MHVRVAESVAVAGFRGDVRVPGGWDSSSGRTGGGRTRGWCVEREDLGILSPWCAGRAINPFTHSLTATFTLC